MGAVLRHSALALTCAGTSSSSLETLTAHRQKQEESELSRVVSSRIPMVFLRRRFGLSRLSASGPFGFEMAPKGQASQGRARWAGDVDQLVAELDSVVAPLGRSWLKFSDDEKVASGAKVDQDATRGAADILEVLHNAHPSLAFKKSDLSTIVEKLLALH
eukprot:12100578-Alexandrium_andersonii.AAC.1